MKTAQIFADLKADHDRHRDLLERIAIAKGEDRSSLFETFRTEVAAHAAAEEESLYATMLAKPDLRDDARHSVSEHKEIDDFLGELSKTDVGSGDWSSRFDAMRKRYEHHIDEEEEEMFPAAAEGLSSDETTRLAKVFERRKPRELDRAEASPPGSDERD